MMSAIVLLTVAGITVVWSLERIRQKKSQYTASYEVTEVIDAGYLARRTEYASQDWGMRSGSAVNVVDPSPRTSDT